LGGSWRKKTSRKERGTSKIRAPNHQKRTSRHTENATSEENRRVERSHLRRISCPNQNLGLMPCVREVPRRYSRQKERNGNERCREREKKNPTIDVPLAREGYSGWKNSVKKKKKKKQKAEGQCQAFIAGRRRGSKLQRR